MKNIKRLLQLTLCALAFIMVSNTAQAQYDLTLYNIGNRLPQGNRLNPAFFPDSRMYLGLPVVSGTSVNVTSGFSLSDAIRENGQNSNVLDLNYLLENISENEFYAQKLHFPLLNLGIRSKRAYFTFDINYRHEGGMNLPKDLLATLARGNGHNGDYKEAATKGFVDQIPNEVLETMNFDNLKLSQTSYTEIGFGYGRRFGDRLHLGAKVKFLWGHANIETEGLEGQLVTRPSNYALRMNLGSSPVIRTAGIMALSDDSESEYDDPMDYILESRNFGMGFDFGGLFRLDDKWSFSASLVDVGYITWKDDIKNTHLENAYEANGEDIDRFFELKAEYDDDFFTYFVDQLEDKYSDPEEKKDKYTTWLNGRMYANATYKVTDYFSTGATFVGHAFGESFNPGLNVFGNLSVKEWLLFNANVGYVNKSFNNVGVGTVFTGGPVQLFLATDNLFGALDLNEARQVDFRFGFNFLIGRKKGREWRDKHESQLKDYRIGSNENSSESDSDTEF
ncbi:hypothetical protein FUAX_24030 [Fulvitalea axinellae]|uniref:DUF5723 domain-containing protein n=1 Tax=Fulvitalea axinellae TaxID=1182444 RepID=A0AAU9DAL5_9BACT|nr:hypothetical protein FUAX_24030 [Fulvitalea axinellae]